MPCSVQTLFDFLLSPYFHRFTFRYIMVTDPEKDQGVKKLERTDSSDDGHVHLDDDTVQSRVDWTEEEEKKLV